MMPYHNVEVRGLQSLLRVRPGLPVSRRARNRGRERGQGARGSNSSQRGSSPPPPQPSRHDRIQANYFCTWRPGASFQTGNTIRTTELELPDFKA